MPDNQPLETDHPETTHLTPTCSCEACSAFTRVAARTLAPSPIRDQLHRRLQPFRHLHDCSGCFRLERSPGGACTHWKAPPCHGAHAIADIEDLLYKRAVSARKRSSLRCWCARRSPKSNGFCFHCGKAACFAPACVGPWEASSSCPSAARSRVFFFFFVFGGGGGGGGPFVQLRAHRVQVNIQYVPQTRHRSASRIFRMSFQSPMA